MNRLKVTDISHAVDDLAKHCNSTTVERFMQKWGIDAEEYNWLSFAAIPATAYRGALHSCKWNKSRIVSKVEDAIAVGENAKDAGEALKLMLEILRKATVIAEQPMEYVEEEEEDAKAG